jgi:AmiR/NasT family two-component response regulator
MSRIFRVLIADDEALICNLIQSELEAIGHEVIGRASDGRQALAMACALDPDIVLMDIAMPEMDGLEAARQIQKNCPRPVVLLTAHDDLDLVTRAGEVGAGAYIVKPPYAPELARAMAIASARFNDMTALRRANEALQKALDEVKTLQGILPICSSCRKVRDDDGYWHEVEVYVEQHSELEFSHGLCELCSKALYPEEYEALMLRKARGMGAKPDDSPAREA